LAGARDLLVGSTFVASLAVAASLLVAHEAITRYEFSACVEAATRVEDALPSIGRLAELRGGLRQVREGAVSALDDPARAVKRSAAALPLVRGQLRPGDDPALVSAVDAVEASVNALVAGEADRAELAAAVVRATDEADRLAGATIERSAAKATLAARRVVDLEERAARFSLLLLGVFLLLLALLTLLTLRLFVRAERARALQLEELDAFAARVAHDLRDPLSPIDMAIDLLRREPTLSESARRLVDRQRSALSRAYDLIDALLEFARAGGPTDRTVSSDLAAVLREVEVSLMATAKQENALLAVRAQEGLRAQLPPAVLGTIVTNLAKNALVHLGDAASRSVTIDATLEGASVVLLVTDHGPGLPPDSLATLFTPFVRGTTRSGGHGLGLATTKRLVEAYGGAIGVRSRPGEGSIFEVRLPRGGPRGRAPGASADPVVSPPRGELASA
jgi:signal transduction histidine kinase